MEQIKNNYERSLVNKNLLQHTPLKTFDPIIIKDKVGRKFRPTLFDFLGHRAVDFFMSDEYGVVQPANRFEINNEDYFAQSDEFSRLAIESNDTSSLQYHAILILQQLVLFHVEDDDPAALLDVDLKRLKFVYAKSTLENKETLFLQALSALQNRFTNHPGSGEVAVERAKIYQQKGNNYDPYGRKENRWFLKEAHEICTEILEKHPGSDGATSAEYIIQQIEEPVLNVNIHGAEIPGKPFLGAASYKNISGIYFKVVQVDPQEAIELDRNLNDESKITQYLENETALEWNAKFEDPGDFQNHHTEFNTSQLKPGYYVLLAGTDPKFSTKNNVVSFVPFWITQLSFISQEQKGGAMQFFVLDRESGKPVSDVQLTIWSSMYQYSIRQYVTEKIGEYTSDKNGFLEIQLPEQRSHVFFLDFSKGNDRYIARQRHYPIYHSKNEKPTITTDFFTDRSIYRPGQSIYFKGIILEHKGDEHRILKDHSTTVELYDVNHQKISELQLVSNEFGSISGSFMAPLGGLTGDMRIQNKTGSVYISVEEYKRPKFEVLIDPVEGSYKLNQNVNIAGEAKAFAGNPIDNANVKYRVVRSAHFPWWYGWRGYWPIPSSPEVEIINGFATTDDEGKYQFVFQAIPDKEISQELKPVFNYQVFVDVTDLNGETHSSETRISVGYNALNVNLDIPEKVDISGKQAFSMKVTNLNGEPVNVTGKIRIYKLAEPNRLMRERDWQRPDVFLMNESDFIKNHPNDQFDNELDVSDWKKGKPVLENNFNTETDSLVEFAALESWDIGQYCATLETTDEFGTDVTVEKYFTLFSPGHKQMPGLKTHWLHFMNEKAEPGEAITFVVGSSHPDVQIIYEIENNSEIVHREWLKINNEQRKIEIPVLEEFRGNFSVNLAFVKNNRCYEHKQNIEVPYTNKKLDIVFETFRSKLYPGENEEWRLRIKDYQGEQAASELLAGMYDASLDELRPHNWRFAVFHSRFGKINWEYQQVFDTEFGRTFKNLDIERIVLPYRQYDYLNWFGFRHSRSMYDRPMFRSTQALEPGMAKMMVEGNAEGYEIDAIDDEEAMAAPPTEPVKKEKKSTPVQIRKNFQETAFFFPQLKTDENGDVLISFQIPESLTRWKMMGIAHTQDLSIGQITKEIITQKDLMVVPNPPRFLRQGDRMQFTVKVVSMSDENLSGQAELQFFDAYTMNPVEGVLVSENNEQDFSVEKGKSTLLSWAIEVPDNMEVLVYRIVAEAGQFSDGEEQALPVLPNRMLVTETLPLPVRGKSTKNFGFDKLTESGKSSSLKNYKLTLEYTSNPAWYAVQALPFLIEFPHDCSEQLFSRYYANSLGSFIANSDPKIKQVFDSWKSQTPDALVSNLEKNEALKSVLLTETPWVRQGKNESEQKQRIAQFFELNQLTAGLQQALNKLEQQQLPSGAWPWFRGMHEDRYITQHIVTGFGKLHHLGVIDLSKNQRIMNMMRKALSYLDRKIEDDYNRLINHKADLTKRQIGYIQIQYLYGRSFFKELIPNKRSNEVAYTYYFGQAQKFWLEFNKFMQGYIALGLFREGDETTPQSIVKSLKEHALHSEEMGMYWRGNSGYYWHEAPIEQQALLIEVFDEITHDEEAVQEMNVWLLKQKQTQHWKTTKATTDAVYALLLRGSDLLASNELVDVSLGGEKIDPLNLDGAQVEAGTGYFQTSWSGNSITPDMGNIEVSKKDDGIAWGAVYWQYYEDLDKITSAETPLSVEKKLYIEVNTPEGPVLTEIDENRELKVGDKVKVRIIIRTDRTMEYLHLKDQRAATFEPVTALSGYRYQGGLGYYESIKDASMNFFFNRINKGTYVLEYPLLVNQAGEFSNGITTLQCMYAPEFSSHSEGIRMVVK